MRSSTTPDCNSWQKTKPMGIKNYTIKYAADSLCQRCRCSSHLAHLGDGVIEHSAGVVGPLADQLDLPGSRRQPQLQRVQAHHLLCDLHENGLARAPPVGEEEAQMNTPQQRLFLVGISFPLRLMQIFPLSLTWWKSA